TTGNAPNDDDGGVSTSHRGYNSRIDHRPRSGAVVTGDTCRFGDSATPDRYPIVDAPTEAPDGLVVATGTHGFGIMAAPTIGKAIRLVATDESGPFSVEPFSLDRFEDRSTDFGSSYIAESPELVGPQT
ncbi:MAG: hypothetical protein ACQET5_16535, partial [Halobacteriota archaeon]